MLLRLSLITNKGKPILSVEDNVDLCMSVPKMIKRCIISASRMAQKLIIGLSDINVIDLQKAIDS